MGASSTVVRMSWEAGQMRVAEASASIAQVPGWPPFIHFLFSDWQLG